jgi:hypothetical protein
MAERRIAFTLKNERGEKLPIFVEPWPEHYKLCKNETLKIVFEPSADVAEVVEVVAHGEGFTIYPNFANNVEITIDGKDASHRSWKD